jgi:hypothetical protein
MPSLEANCQGTEASDCLGSPGFSAGAAALKTPYIVWMEDTSCNERGTSEYAKGQGTSLTQDVGGNNVQYVLNFSYGNSPERLQQGSYAAWMFIDTNGNGELDQGEPVACKSITINGEVGSLEYTSGWRDATASDESTLL